MWETRLLKNHMRRRSNTKLHIYLRAMRGRKFQADADEHNNKPTSILEKESVLCMQQLERDKAM